jgi:tetratricopeptide (TPR) repeat protein
LRLENAAESSMVESAGALCGERVAFTGTLASMTHRQAQALVEQHGGTATGHVSRQTTILVVGEEGWPLEADGTTSVKLQQATHWQADGAAVRILRESDWLGVLGLDEHRQELHRQYTPAMLCQLLDVPVSVIRSWERSGLIKPVRRVFRLPYFDFQEVASARRLADLIAAGVPRKEIEASLAKLEAVLGSGQRPLAQLEILAADHKLLYRDAQGLCDPLSGQRLFEFDAAAMEAGPAKSEPVAIGTRQVQTHWTADDWQAEACRHLEAGELQAAVEAFRLCLMDQPTRAEVHFQLAETLYRLENLAGALERYHITVELDPQYLEAWTQLGCLHEQLGEFDSALHAFDIALDLHPDYPDAHLHKAEVLHRLGRGAEAVEHWRTYLKFDQRGPWADNARQRLEEAGAAD